MPRDKAESGAPTPDALDFCRKWFGFEPDPWQQEVLLWTGKRGILNCSRQSGKTKIAAAKAVHQAMTEDGSLILIASPTTRQSGEFLVKAAELTRRAGVAPRGDGHNPVSLLFPNGSRIVGLPGVEGNIRGFSAVSLIVVDEASRVADALYRAIRPMLGVGDGALWLLSTPFGKRGFFYEEWEHGSAEWKRFAVQAAQCPRLKKEFLEEERRALGDAWFRQEYCGEFLEDEFGMFERAVVEEALSDDWAPLQP